MRVPHEFSFTFNVSFGDAPINLRTVLVNSITELLRPYFDNKNFDQLRVGKTLLNLGGNRQAQIINWKRYGDDGTKIALRLAENWNELYPQTSATGSQATISREIQNSVFDVIKFVPIDVAPPVPQLRPSTPMFASRHAVKGNLTTLVPDIAGGSGALGGDSTYSSFVTNQVLENYYNVNQRSMDINVDHSNFENFVTFGSAKKRIDVFKAKLEKIQELVKTSPVFVENLNISGSSAEEGSYATVFGTLVVASNGSVTLTQTDSPAYDVLKDDGTGTGTDVVDYVNTSMEVSKQTQELVRGFDGYEKELWFESNLPYSASDDTNHAINNQTKDDYTYPKILGIPYATTATPVANTWYPEMTSLAEHYDLNNKNRLTENIPNYLFEDEDSVDFVTFTDLVGHHFDNIKSYIKNLENLSSRYPKVDKEISSPMAAHVLESYGVSIPSIASVESLVRYVSGDNTGSVAYKKIADEYYKRYVHALPFLLKSKGTKQSVNSLLNVFGIDPNFITVRESLAGGYTTIEPVKVTTTEQNFSLQINSGSWLNVPFASNGRTPKPQTVQARFSLLDARNQTVLNFEPSCSYRLNAERHPDAATNTYYTNYGRLDLVSGSSAAGTMSMATTDYFDLFDENPVNIQLKYDAGGVKFKTIKMEDETISFSSSLQESAPSMSADWDVLSNLYIGPPAKSSSVAYHLSASLDEFRVWGEPISDAKCSEFVENPGMYAGPSHTSSLQSLYVRLSFNTPEDVEDLGYVANTTPYVSKSQAGLLDLANISSSADDANGVAFSAGSSPLYQSKRNIRTVIENSYKEGANISTTDMIRIAPDPPSSGFLSRVATVTNIDKKFQTSSMGSTRLDISISPQDAIDRDVIRSFGNFNLGDYIGRPIDRNANRYPLLEEVDNTFTENILPTPVTGSSAIDYNNFIRYFDKFLHLFGEAVRDYFPARARITDGIVIRSSVLNRNKLNTRGISNIVMDGETTRKTNNAITSTTDKSPVRSFSKEISVMPNVTNILQADFSSVDSSLSLSSYTAGHSVSRTIVASTEAGYDQSGFNSLNTTVERPKKEQGLLSLFAGNATASLHANEPIQDGALSFRPIDDFTPENFGAYTYFGPDSGLTLWEDTKQIPITQSFMPAAPTVSETWAANTSYIKGDVVKQPVGTKSLNASHGSPSGSELTENGKYFVMRHPSLTAIKSADAPQTDPEIWTPLTYRTKVSKSMGRFVYSVAADAAVGTVSLLKDTTISQGAGGYHSVANEYARNHFKFTRENSIGARRRTYEGTLNTKATSFDEAEPIESFGGNTTTITVGPPVIPVPPQPPPPTPPIDDTSPPRPPVDEKFNGNGENGQEPPRHRGGGGRPPDENLPFPGKTDETEWF